jgi:hypothetical protein
MYEVIVSGIVESRHRTAKAAKEAAETICRRDGLVDDGACCGDDGWPSIVDPRRPEVRIDYDAPTSTDE